MVFVDGENLAIRYGKMLLNKGADPVPHIVYRPNVYVWSSGLRRILLLGGTVRTYYYTLVEGDELARETIHDDLERTGVEAPRVFRKTKERARRG